MPPKKKATKKRRRRNTSTSPSFHEPTPRQEFDFSLDRAVEKATLMHPQTRKLRREIEKSMRAAAKQNSQQSEQA